MKKVWHYSIPGGSLGDWAEILIREDGFFSTVGGYGNYSYMWNSTGEDDVRKFFLRLDWHYFAKKLNPRRVIDDEASLKNLKEIIESDEDLEPEDKEDRLSHLSQFNSWEDFLRDPETDGTFDGETPWECGVTTLESDVTNFAKIVLPQLAKLIEAELHQEAQNQQDEHGRTHT